MEDFYSWTGIEGQQNENLPTHHKPWHDALYQFPREAMMNQGAIIDPTGYYRYSLWRVWNPKTSRVAFIMLNPSRADATVNDPTIRRCIGFAQRWGYGSLEVVNLFAYRTSDPAILKQMRDPVGPENDFYLKQAIQQAKLTILAWGNRGNLNQRSQQVLSWLIPSENCYCLGVTRSGHPRHPLYLKRETKPIAYFPLQSGARLTEGYRA